MQAVSGYATWTDHGKHRVRMEAMSRFLTHGARFIWLTLNPSDVDSPFVMHYNGQDIDLSSPCWQMMPQYIDVYV